nr:hypothetical protein [uncultured Fluviicola sp.]
MLLIILIICLEGIIFGWAIWTTETGFVFDKCARNSGRVSSLINLVIICMVGYHGLKKIYSDEQKKDAFRVLMTGFTINHLIHFFYVFQNFKSHDLILGISENLHGFITFIFIVIVPVILWSVKRLTKLLYIFIPLHLMNVSYFIMETFYSKVKPESPAYHNQLGILVTSVALLYMLYRYVRENRRNFRLLK